MKKKVNSALAAFRKVETEGIAEMEEGSLAEG